MKRCPNCGSTDTDPRANMVYVRECQNCLFMDDEEAFETDPEPKWSWHIIEHEEIAWQVVQIKHYPARLKLESLAVRLTREEAEKIVETMRQSAERLGRKRAYG